MTIVVTGGAGFIGSNFIFHMLKAHPDYRIVCLDKLTYAGNLTTLAPVMEKQNFRFVKLDICDREGVYRLFEEEKPDIIVNFAAESHVDRSIENPGVFLQTHAGNTASNAITRCPPTRSTAICPWTDQISSLRRRPRSTQARPIPRPRPGRICW